MIEVCLALVLAMASARPQDFNQFPRSSQSFFLNTENENDRPMEENNSFQFNGFKPEEYKFPRNYDHRNEFENYGNHKHENYNFNENFGPHEHKHRHEHDHHHEYLGSSYRPQHFDLLAHPEYPDHPDHHAHSDHHAHHEHNHQQHEHGEQHQFHNHHQFQDQHQHPEPKQQHDGHHPLPKYDYDYKVENPHTGDYKAHREIRVGDTVHGFYAFHEADGTTRLVEYTSDKHDGFKAKVKHEGRVTHETPK